MNSTLRHATKYGGPPIGEREPRGVRMAEFAVNILQCRPGSRVIHRHRHRLRNLSAFGQFHPLYGGWDEDKECVRHTNYTPRIGGCH